MACSEPHLYDYLANFSGMDPLRAVYCPFVQTNGGGAGMGMAVFGLFFFGIVGLGLTVRTQHPGPIIVASMLSAGVAATALPGIASQILAIVIMFGLVAAGFYLIARARSSY